MPLHTYIEEHFIKHPEARSKGIHIENPPIEKRPKVFHVEDTSAKNGDTNIPIRIYTPILDEEELNQHYPLFIYFHGGAFIPGSLETHDITCRLICSLSGYKVIAVDYRLDPDQFEAVTLQDCYTTTNWIVKNAENFRGHPDDIAVGGASIGAYLATVVALKSVMTSDFNLTKQVLYYPIIELNEKIQEQPYLSRKMYNAKYGLDITMLHPSHLQITEIPYLNPLIANQTILAKMPEALVFTAEYDPLCDEGELYADKLKEAGVQIKIVRFDGNIHGFMQSFPGSPDYMRGYDLTTEFLLEE